MKPPGFAVAANSSNIGVTSSGGDGLTPERLVVCASHSPGKERDVEHAFGRLFRSALTSAAERAQQFDPDVVIVFGGDHRRAFRHVVPAFGVALSASILAEGGHPAGDLDVPSAAGARIV